MPQAFLCWASGQWSNDRSGGRSKLGRTAQGRERDREHCPVCQRFVVRIQDDALGDRSRAGGQIQAWRITNRSTGRSVVEAPPPAPPSPRNWAGARHGCEWHRNPRADRPARRSQRCASRRWHHGALPAACRRGLRRPRASWRAPCRAGLRQQRPGGHGNRGGGAGSLRSLDDSRCPAAALNVRHPSGPEHDDLAHKKALACAIASRQMGRLPVAPPAAKR